MIRYEKSDITKVTNGIIAHGVNCHGVMGAGVALAIRKKWPAVYDLYTKNVAPTGMNHQLLGSCHIIRVDASLWVANCYSQLNYGRVPMRYASPKAIEQSLRFVYATASAYDVDVHSVKIGSDLGGLDWETDVRPIFEALNSEYGVDTTIHYI